MAGQKLRVFEEVDPASVLTPTSALVIALRTLGVPAAEPPMPWHEQVREEVEGKTVRRFIWRLLDTKAADGTDVKTIVQRWNDPAWLQKNPTHEIAVLRNGLLSAVHVAGLVRGTVARDKIRNGRHHVLIPVDATPGERAHWLGKLEGRIPAGERYVAQTADGNE